MTLKFQGTFSGIKIYTSDNADDNKIYAFSKTCRSCGEEIDIFSNTAICWLSKDRTHHPNFVLIDNLGEDELKRAKSIIK